MTNKINELGRKLMQKCPDNDCIIFRNLYEMFQGVNDDLSGCLLSERGRHVLEKEQRRLERELEMMYRTNYAVQMYKKEIWG